VITDASATATAPSPHTRSGAGYAVLAGASAAVLLFLPTLILGFTVSVIASVLGGDVVAWVSSVGMTYTFIGVPAVAGLILLFLPYRLFRTAERRLGTRRAVRFVGGLLVVWNAAIALLWLSNAIGASASSTSRPEVWYAVAFGIAALVALIITVALDRQRVGAAVAAVAALGGAVIALVAMLVVVWDSPPRIPIDAQTVRIEVDGGEVRLDPSTVRAGDIYFVVDGATDAGGHGEFAFVSAGYGEQCPPCETPLPMSDEGIARLAQGDYQGTSIEGGWSEYAKFAVLPGKYAFIVSTSGGDGPGTRPDSIATLEVTP
jgi:hypothetical protein